MPDTWHENTCAWNVIFIRGDSQWLTTETARVNTSQSWGLWLRWRRRYCYLVSLCFWIRFEQQEACGTQVEQAKSVFAICIVIRNTTKLLATERGIACKWFQAQIICKWGQKNISSVKIMRQEHNLEMATNASLTWPSFDSPERSQHVTLIRHAKHNTGHAWNSQNPQMRHHSQLKASKITAV